MNLGFVILKERILRLKNLWHIELDVSFPLQPFWKGLNMTSLILMIDRLLGSVYQNSFDRYSLLFY